MEGRRGRELPRFLNYSLCETIVRERLQEYKDPCFECLYSIDSLAERVFLFLVDKTFEQFDEVKSDLKVISIFFQMI